MLDAAEKPFWCAGNAFRSTTATFATVTNASHYTIERLLTVGAINRIVCWCKSAKRKKLRWLLISSAESPPSVQRSLVDSTSTRNHFWSVRHTFGHCCCRLWRQCLIVFRIVHGWFIQLKLVGIDVAYNMASRQRINNVCWRWRNMFYVLNLAFDKIAMPVYNECITLSILLRN